MQNFLKSLNWLYDRQKYGWKLGLENVQSLMHNLHNPHRKFAAVHIAGTNGKGSVAAMTASVLQSMGYKTGLYTSPHLCSILERISLNGICMAEKEFIDYADIVKPFAEKHRSTFFETLTAMAFAWFADNETDIAVIETGLGGRLDATNIIRPEISVITSISADHTQYLGTRLEDIAAEKAGIIKPGTPCLIGDIEETGIFLEKTRELDAPFYRLSDFCRITIHSLAVGGSEFTLATPYHHVSLHTALTGKVHVGNAALAVSAVGIMTDSGWDISEKAICNGLNDFSRPGRFEIIAENPLTIIDSAHNKASIENLVQLFKQFFTGRPVSVILGVSADKDIDAILDGIQEIAHVVYPVAADNPRALAAADLENRVREKKIRCVSGSTDRKSVV